MNDDIFYLRGPEDDPDPHKDYYDRRLARFLSDPDFNRDFTKSMDNIDKYDRVRSIPVLIELGYKVQACLEDRDFKEATKANKQLLAIIEANRVSFINDWNQRNQT